MPHGRSLSVQVLPSSRSSNDPAPAAKSVAVVARDDLALHRIRETLTAAGIELLEVAAAVDELSELAAGADSIVLVGGTAASKRKSQVRDAAARFPTIPVVMIAPASSNSVHKAMEAGASGWVYDSQIESALAATVGAVAAGQVVVPRGLHRHATRPALSHRERQTLALVVMGLTNRQIAARLFLAESTVKTHLTSIFGKLGVGSRSEAVAVVLDSEQKLGLGVLGLSPGAPIVSGAERQHA
jgi:DNA-binding NarL/FixJ family response regulator